MEIAREVFFFLSFFVVVVEELALVGVGKEKEAFNKLRCFGGKGGGISPSSSSSSRLKIEGWFFVSNRLVSRALISRISFTFGFQ